MIVDVVLGLQYGDEGKGKICHSLLSLSKYSHVLRFNGGGNAGHTIYHNGVKLVTHLIPSGVFYGIKSIIGPGCVVNVEKFFEELKYLEVNGINTKDLVFIAKNTHIVFDYHVKNDQKDSKIGTTKSGNGPAYSDKYAREGLRAENLASLQPYLIDMYSEFYENPNQDIRILAEGAQAFGLDIDWGDYPYVTSSHCGIGSVLLNGFNHNHIGKVYGIIKAYETYVGEKKFQSDDPRFELIQVIGQEFGATTGRKRQCNCLDADLLMKAIKMNGVDELIINKMDVLNSVQTWQIKFGSVIFQICSEEEFKAWFHANLDIPVHFSYSPHNI